MIETNNFYIFDKPSELEWTNKPYPNLSNLKPEEICSGSQGPQVVMFLKYNDSSRLDYGVASFDYITDGKNMTWVHNDNGDPLEVYLDLFGCRIESWAWICIPKSLYQVNQDKAKPVSRLESILTSN